MVTATPTGKKARELDRQIRFARFAAAAVMILAANAIDAADFEWYSQLALGLTYSDNIRLEPEALAQDDRVLQVNPELGVTGGAGIFEVDAYYRAQVLFYDKNDEQDDVFHQFRGQGVLELIPENLFLEVGGSYAQSTVDPEQQFIYSNTSITQNRTDVANIWVAPYYQYRILRGEGTARYERRASLLEDSNLQDVDEDFISADWASESVEGRSGATLELDYRYDRYDYEQSDEVVFHEAQTRLGYWLNESFNVFTIQGVEDDYRMPTDSSLSEYFWYVGARWNPTRRSSLEVSGGDRSYGNSFFARAEMELRRGRISLEYRDGASTTVRSRNRRAGREGVTSREFVDDELGRNLEESLDRPGDESVYVEKRLEGEVVLQSDKTGFRWRVYYDRREDQIALTGMDIRGDERAVGTDAELSWALGNKTVLVATGEYLDREFGDNTESTLYQITFGLDYAIGKRTSVLLAVGHYEQESDNLMLDDVKEDRINLFIRRNLFGSAPE